MAALGIADTQAQTIPSVSLNAHTSKQRFFSRFTFNYSAPVFFTQQRQGNTLALTFSSPVSIDLTNVLINTGEIVIDATQPDERTLVFVLSDPKARIRSFISDGSVGFDLIQSNKKRVRSFANYKLPSSAGLPWLNKEPEFTTKPTTKPELPTPVSPPIPLIKPTVDEEPPMPEIEEPLNKTPEQMLPVESTDDVIKPVHIEENRYAGFVSENTNNNIVGDLVLAQDTLEDSLITPEELEAARKADEKVEAEDRSGMLSIQRNDLEKGMQIVFPWEYRVSMASFLRNGYLWVVFSRPIELDLENFKLEPFFVDKEQLENKQYTILRLKLAEQYRGDVLRYATDRNSRNWLIDISELGEEGGGKTIITDPLPITVNATTADPFVLVQGNEFGNPIKVTDPDVGDLLVIVPSLKPRKGISPVRQFIDFTLLETLQGIAVQRKADQLLYKINSYGFALSGLYGLNVSKNVGIDPTIDVLNKDTALLGTDLPTVVPYASIFPFERVDLATREKREKVISRLMEKNVEGEEKHGEEEEESYDVPTLEEYIQQEKDYFNTRRKELLAAVTEAPEGEVTDRRLELAQFYFANQYYSEAHGLLREIKQRDPDYDKTLYVDMILAATKFLVHQYKDAYQSFLTLYPIINNTDSAEEIKLWLWAGQRLSGASREQDSKEVSIDYIASYDKFQSNYPHSLRYRFGLMAVESQIAKGNIDSARSILEIISFADVPPEYVNYTQFLQGMIANELGDIAGADKIWTDLSNVADDRYIRARATYELVKLQLINGISNVPDAIERLERLSLVWRGDELEIDILKLLGELQVREKKYTEGLRTWKTLVSNYPGTTDAIIVAGKMKRTFTDLFENGAAFEMEPFEALSLFFEFRELTPLGPRGDKMIQQLADHFVEVDLIDNATAILDHQARYRATGEERHRIALKLADLYLANKQADKAFETLEYIEVAEADEETEKRYFQLWARALIQQGDLNEAVKLVNNDASREGQDIIVEVFWQRRNWMGIIRILEKRFPLYNEEPNEPLSKNDVSDILRLAVAYKNQGMPKKNRVLRAMFLSRINDPEKRETFEFLTRDKVVLDHKNFKDTVQLEDIERFMLRSFYWPEKDWTNVISVLRPMVTKLDAETELSDQHRKDVVRLAIALMQSADGNEDVIKEYETLQRDFRTVFVDNTNIEVLEVFSNPVLPVQDDVAFDSKAPLTELPKLIEIYNDSRKMSEVNIRWRELTAK